MVWRGLHMLNYSSMKPEFLALKWAMTEKFGPQGCWVYRQQSIESFGFSQLECNWTTLGMHYLILKSSTALAEPTRRLMLCPGSTLLVRRIWKWWSQVPPFPNLWERLFKRNKGRWVKWLLWPGLIKPSLKLLLISRLIQPSWSSWFTGGENGVLLKSVSRYHIPFWF